MDPPPASPPLSAAAPPHLNNSDDSSAGGGSNKLRLMCSYGGHIVPRPHGKSLCYVGGDTRIVAADRRTSLADLTARLARTLLGGRSFALKYQLPGEDLDSLVSVTTDEDLENMIDEHDRAADFPKPSRLRLRLFLFPSTGPEGSAEPEGWSDRGFSDSASVNCLLGLDDDPNIPNPTGRGNVAVADSPLLETTSSFGSASSSSSSLANLPPIRVHVEDFGASIATGLKIQDQRLGIEEQFAQIGVSTGQKLDEGFVVQSSLPQMPVSSMLIGSEYSNWVVSDDERSDHGVPVVYSKPPIQQPQPQQKPSGGIDLASPDSVSSDGSAANPLSRGKPVVYQEQLVQIPSVTSRVNANPVDQQNAQVSIQHQVARDPGYVLQHQFDQQQQQQFIHSGGHYIQHHPRGVPIQAYYRVYHPHQQQYDHQYQPVYYMPARPVQAYNISEAPIATPSSLPQTPPSPTMVQEIAAGVYRTTTPPQMVQVPSSHHQQQQQQRQQYIGFSQMQYPSQPVAPASNYAYEYVEPAHTPMYYTQPLASTMSASQYQTMTGAGAVVLPDGSAQHPNDAIKQQIRTSQAM